MGGTGFEQGRMQNCLSFCMGLLSFPDQQRRCIDLQKEFTRLYQPGKKTETWKLLRHGASKMLNNRNKCEQGAGLGIRVSTQKGGVMGKKKRADKGEAQGEVGNAEKKNGKEQSTKIPDKNSKKLKKKSTKTKSKTQRRQKTTKTNPANKNQPEKQKRGKYG